MKSLKIKVHSVVQIITNSSTVIYTQADEGTIISLKEMVNALLKIGGSELTADDLFTFELYSDGDESYGGNSDIGLTVTCKSDDENAVLAGKILNNIDNLFNHEAEYDG